jgi:hypothetical protein
MKTIIDRFAEENKLNDEVKENLTTAGIRRMSVHSHNGVFYAMGV